MFFTGRGPPSHEFRNIAPDESNQWKRILFDGRAVETFEEWLDAHQEEPWPPTRASFTRYCEATVPGLELAVQRALWEDYARNGFSEVR